MRTENEPIEQRDDLLPVAGERKQRMEGDSFGDTECPKIQKLVIGNQNPFSDFETSQTIEEYLCKFSPVSFDLPSIRSNPVFLMDCLYSELFVFWDKFRYAHSYSDVFGGKRLGTTKDEKSSSEILKGIVEWLPELEKIVSDPFEVEQDEEEEYFKNQYYFLLRFISRFAEEDFSATPPDQKPAGSWRLAFTDLVNKLEGYLLRMGQENRFTGDGKIFPEDKKDIETILANHLNRAKRHTLSREEARRVEENYFKLRCDGLRCIIQIIGKSLMVVIPNRDSIVEWRLAFLKLVDRIEDYLRRVQQKDWSCEDEKKLAANDILHEIKTAQDNSASLAEQLLDREQTCENIGRFLVFRKRRVKKDEDDLLKIIADPQGPVHVYEGFPSRTVKIIEELLAVYPLSCTNQKKGWIKSNEGWRQAFQHRDHVAERFYQEQIQRERRDKENAPKEKKIEFWRIIPDREYYQGESDEQDMEEEK
ncbi:MAG: hypothetical protein IJR99_11610 [Kiritimatiellae bacterium]|nr:hypothetical protein [Kiritimatiellia bacterium]